MRRIYFVLFVLIFLASNCCFAQPDYRFSNPTLQAGTNNQVGAVYRFANVKTGFDALVSIDNMYAGATLGNIDRTADGFQEAFQPQINVPANTNGYIDFTITFVNTGTNIAALQTNVNASGLDIDGQTNGLLKLYEYNKIDMGGGLVDFNLLGGHLTVSQNGTAYTAQNVTGVLYGASVDTSAIDVMFTVMKGNISSFTFRAGANNLLSGSATRYASLYFKRFAYPHSLLSTPSLTAFSGITKDKKVELSWSIAANNSLKEVVVERATNPAQFSALTEVWMNSEKENNNNYNFKDNTVLQGIVYYRLKMIAANGQVSYSNVLVFRMDNNKKQSFKMYPSVISDNVTVSIAADKNEQTSLQLVDFSGRTIYQAKIALQQGDNNVAVNGLSSVHQGTYVAVVKAGNNTYSQKIIIQ